MNKPIISAERLRELFSCDPETGIFTRLVSSRKWKSGDVAGTLNHHGYWCIRIDGRNYASHRLAWLFAHGKWPVNHIDHINGHKDDNRLCNLREATRSENMHNQRKARNDSCSGLLGVHWQANRNKWAADITVNGKTVHLGRFQTAESAHTEYLRAKHALHSFSTIEHPGGETYVLPPERVYTSNFKGVSWDKSRQKWSAKITINGKTVNIGRFPVEEDARDAYLKAKIRVTRQVV